MSEAMDQPAGSPENPRPGEGGDGGMEPGTCQELLYRLRELEVRHRARGAVGLPFPLSLVWVFWGVVALPLKPPLPGWSGDEHFLGELL